MSSFDPHPMRVSRPLRVESFDYDATQPTVSERLDQAVADSNRLIARLCGVVLAIGLGSILWLCHQLWR